MEEVCGLARNLRNGRTSLTSQLVWVSKSTVRPPILPASFGMDGCILFFFVKPSIFTALRHSLKVTRGVEVRWEVWLPHLTIVFGRKFYQNWRAKTGVGTTPNAHQGRSSFVRIYSHVFCWVVSQGGWKRRVARWIRATCFFMSQDVTKQNTWCSEFFWICFGFCNQHLILIKEWFLLSIKRVQFNANALTYSTI